MIDLLLILLGAAAYWPFLHRDLVRADELRRRREWERAHPQAVAFYRLARDLARAMAHVGLTVERAGRLIREAFEKPVQR